jgi:beta-glucosidase
VAEGTFNTIYPVPDVCLVFLKAFSTEGYDRESLEAQWNATIVVENTAKLCPNTVVIVHGPGVVVMPWADNENVTAILAAHYPGEQTGNSIVDVLWGVSEPSGRLPYTIPKTAADSGPVVVNATLDANGLEIDFTEGQMFDYRHYDANGIEPQYEFGFGLSYSNHTMPDTMKVKVTPNLSATPDATKGIEPGGLVDLWVPVAIISVEVATNGTRSTFVVPQLYVSFPKETTPEGTPPKVLRGFQKLLMSSCEQKTIEFELLRRDLSYWDVDTNGWVIPEGNFTFSAGFSSRDLQSIRTNTVLV